MKELELLVACRAGASEVVLEVLMEDAGLVAVESAEKKRTPLLIAARAGRRDIVELLLGQEHEGRALVSLDHQDVDGKTALQLASFHGDAEVVALLLAAGADALLADHRGLTPLHIASWQGHPEVVALLLDFHAAACGVWPTSSAPPAHAISGGRRRRRGPFGDFLDEDEEEEQQDQSSSSSVYSEDGAPVSSLAGSLQRLRGLGSNDNGEQGAAAPPERSCVRRSSPPPPRPRRDYWAVIDAVDSRGRTPLYMASCYEQEDVVRGLLGRGANPLLAASTAAAGADSGKRPLDRAVSTGNKPIIAMLLAAEREPQRLLALARLREQPLTPPSAPQLQQEEAETEAEAEAEAEMPTTAEALVQAVGALATQTLPDDLFGELIDTMAPFWM